MSNLSPKVFMELIGFKDIWEENMFICEYNT